ncbi:hypothetical protein BsWGS_26458 [Bradybaena similaris]
MDPANILVVDNSNVKETDDKTLVSVIKSSGDGHTDCVQMTKHGASLDIKYAFQSAVSSNNSVHLKYLAETFKVEIEQVISPKELSNLVVSAAREGHIDIIEVLLDAGAYVDCVSSDKKTPLLESKNADVVNFLVQRGAYINKFRRDIRNICSPLNYVLSSYYFQPDSADKEKIIEALLKHRAAVNGLSRSGRTPLMLAVANRASRNILQMLLDRGANTSLSDRKGNTVLHIAAEIKSTENIEFLLQQKKIRNMINAPNTRGLTAFMIFTKRCNHMAMKILIDHGADVNITDFHGNTALHLALYDQIQKPEILTTLIQAGCDLNSENASGFTPLMLAVKYELKDALMLLVDSGANVNAVSKKMKNETALTQVFKYCVDFRTSFVEYLLDHGAHASYVEPYVILQLIEHKNMQLIQKLIQYGLGPVAWVLFHKLFYYGPVNAIKHYTPLWMALLRGRVKLAQYFVDNIFITNSDVLRLALSRDAKQHFVRSNNLKCVEFLEKLSAQPLSLFSLAFVSMQSAVGTGPGREERVGMLPLPQVMKDRLLFKMESVAEIPCEMSDEDTLETDDSLELSMILDKLDNLTPLEYAFNDADYDLVESDYERDSIGDDYHKEYAQFSSDDD